MDEQRKNNIDAVTDSDQPLAYADIDAINFEKDDTEGNSELLPAPERQRDEAEIAEELAPAPEREEAELAEEVAPPLEREDEEFAAEVATPPIGATPRQTGVLIEPEDDRPEFEREAERPTFEKGRGLAITGLILAVMSLFVLSGVLGPIGALLGFFAYRQGHVRMGFWSMVIGISAFALSVLLAFMYL